MTVTVHEKRTGALHALGAEISACTICMRAKNPLPHEPRPVCVLSQTARICIAGQAPGTRVHESGKPFTDPSGDRLRDWMGVDEAVFYDPARIVIVPMGFCFPGLDSKGGDKPPRRECRSTWHDRVFAAMPQIDLLLVIGMYARDYHLDVPKGEKLRETVARWPDFANRPDANGRTVFPLPHPSWRNNAWLKKNAWFDADVLPGLRKKVAERL